MVSKIAILYCLPVLLHGYFDSQIGKEYKIGYFDKLNLVFRMMHNNRRIPSASNFLEHLTMALRLMTIPKTIEGCVVECGSYKGGSSANLSLICALCGRRLEIFDSFEGLPEPSIADKEHIIASLMEVHSYERGAYKGRIDEVKQNIQSYGSVQVCNFNEGLFEKTLPFFAKKCCFIFLDVDLRESEETCLQYLWPLLQDGGYLFTHEAPHLKIASLFFDKDWWHEKLNCEPPGLIGAGSGLGLIPSDNIFFESGIGYTIKNPRFCELKKVSQVGSYV